VPANTPQCADCYIYLLSTVCSPPGVNPTTYRILGGRTDTLGGAGVRQEPAEW
jgi:hypothetical protein